MSSPGRLGGVRAPGGTGVRAPGGTGVRVPVLMYHEVAEGSASRLAVTPRAFAAQLAWLRTAGFTPVTMSSFASALAGAARLPERPVVLTFDDGYADFHSAVLPLLAGYGFTATVYVTTGWVSGDGAPAVTPPARMLTWTQVREAAAAGVEVAAHSHTHRQLDQLPAAQLARELALSRKLLEDCLAQPVTGMAYPYGYSSARVRDAVRASGYTHACAVGNAVADGPVDMFAIQRLTVRRSTTPSTFASIVAARHIPLIFAKDRALTKAWAVPRRTRAALSTLTRR